ncbi:MAG: SRPBCC family protein [Bacteroidia bacterium]|nr:SRPBCC family protein [Bacteroidia bacterium]
MKYSIQTIIDAPLDKFIAIMDDPERMIHWQRGLVGHEFVEGEPGKPGSKMRLDYDLKGRKFSLMETVISSDLPNSFEATYEMPGMYNAQVNTFESTPDGQTRWTTDAEFTSDKFLYKIMMFLMPGQFKKQSRIIMDDLKAYVEFGKSVASDT